jgi:hypothetical protein
MPVKILTGFHCVQPLIAPRSSRQNSTTSASVATPPSTSSVGPVVTYPEVVPLGQVAAPAPLPRIKIARRSGTGLKPAKPVGVTEIPERRSRRDIITITQLKFCKEVLDYIYRPEFETWAYPFMSPVGTLFPPFTSSSLVGTILETCLPVIETTN